MKTFRELTVGDSIFRCHEGSMDYQKYQVTRVETNELTYGYSEKMQRLDKTSVRLDGSYHNKFCFFTTEVSAIRYCKAQLMKSLFGKINSVKAAIKDVVDFKKQHFELLNHQWTFEEINKLEKQTNQL